MSKGNGKKQGIAENFKPVESLFHRFIPGLLLAAFVLLSMASLLSIQRLQGDARTINYAGIVRGATQRLIKQEMNAAENDELIGTLDGILTGLSAGGGEYQLTVLRSPEFQSDLSEMEKSWTRIKEEIYQVRGGADTRTLYELSESYFSLTNQAVSAAEAYSEKKVLSSTRWISLLNGVFVLVAVLFGIYQSRQKKVYQELVIAERASREKSRFLSQMSHEIRTPMNGIIGMTQIAKESINNTEKLEECLGKIQLSSDYLLSLINDILDMSRIENGKIELYHTAFDLRSFAERLSTMFTQKAADAGLSFSVTTGNITAPAVVGDELRLTQIVVNLISNALKFTPEGGEILVALRQERQEDDFCRLTIEVRDTGIGMTEEFLKKIFEPFEQADSSISHKYGGTGLGLAISHNLIQLMGGQISVQSKEGEGTCFQVGLRLPVTDSNVPEIAPSARIQSEERLDGYRILLAEDNAINSEIATSLLAIKGAKVDPVWDGKEALEQFAQSTPGAYQVVLMDIQMPVMNGLEACRKIRSCGHAQAKTIPIIGLSANAFQQDAGEAMDSGMNGYVSKPFDLKELVHAIRLACGE
ncbi:ATP-binding protein [Cuneatibacter sp. NSJ-177]|uniref:ATP-binding protein n=1 Tax=Cuneatibacter sp. NSJ-177 TaxID=2931401 RepID=UPI001FD158BF|nr:ATP-binding protein [Cuneatibacter sp. NSJ-177]MCJ7837141.1 ATP-binding protein [Cuneatibacter sp. NSJ-177]